MGHLRRHAIVVSSFDGIVDEAHAKALEVFGVEDTPGGRSFAQLVSPIVSGMTNGERSFFIAPDGSKEWWDTSNAGDALRAEYVGWLRSSAGVEWVEVQFGDDDHQTLIVGHSDEEC